MESFLPVRAYRLFKKRVTKSFCWLKFSCLQFGPPIRTECLNSSYWQKEEVAFWGRIIWDYFSLFHSGQIKCRTWSVCFFFRNKSYNKCKRRGQTDHLQPSKLYLIKTMQKESFCRELSFLHDSTKSKTSNLVKNLNVFLDQEGILRMDGKIANFKRYGYEVKYPLLLGKHHPYTELLINEFHQQSNHLGISTTIAKISMAGF